MSTPAANHRIEEHAFQPVKVSDSLFRLTWAFPGPLESSITVLDDVTDRDGPSQPYFQPRGNGPVAPHPISVEPTTIPPVGIMYVISDEWDVWHQELRRPETAGALATASSIRGLAYSQGQASGSRERQKTWSFAIASILVGEALVIPATLASFSRHE